MTLADDLLTAEAVRTRCGTVLQWVADGHSPHFTWHPERLPEVARLVIETTHARHADLAAVPFHSRWRHFEAGGVDRWRALVDTHGLQDRHERARVAIDLVIPSVLLDAGAGAEWRYVDQPSQQTLTRSEGLGVASLRWFATGAWSADTATPLRTDAAALQTLRPQALATAFQVNDGNPLVGLPGRVDLLRRLGDVMAANPVVFGATPRLGHLYDHLRTQSAGQPLHANLLLRTLLLTLGPVWPGRATLDGLPLGDCWQHPALPDRWVPFHKLTQWLAYSLLEPLADAGLPVAGLDALTGLPEYRNGGLLLDTGLLQPRDPAFHTHAWRVDDEAIVEWRAVTVIALDQIAAEIRAQCGLSAEQLPLARVLEGGTWAAGRRLAAERRPGGAPPLTLLSDGTVF